MNNPYSLEGKTILVTGASSGIGQGVAIECAKAGAKLILNGRNIERLNETLSQLQPNNHIVIASDLSTQEGIDSLIAESPVLDGMVLSAGIPKICNVKRISREIIQDVVNVNTFAPVLLTSGLLKNKKLNKPSSLVYLSSLAGPFTTNIGEAPYATSKSAVTGFVKSVAYELAPLGIRANTLCPGMVVTHMVTSGNPDFDNEETQNEMLKRYPLKRFGKPEDIGHAAVFLLSDASSWITGVNLKIDGGYSLA